MKNEIFDQNIRIEYPDDYSLMSDAEIKKFFASDLPRMGVRNVEKHTILSVSKTKNSLLSLITDEKSVLAGAERSFKRLNGYTPMEEFDEEIFGKPAKGVRFAYSAIAGDKNVRQFCEMTVVKMKRCFCVVYCLARLDDEQESKETFAAFRRSLQIV